MAGAAARLTVAGMLPIRCMMPTEQTGQIYKERPVRAS
jgi:hypothetical protein